MRAAYKRLWAWAAALLALGLVVSACQWVIVRRSLPPFPHFRHRLVPCKQCHLPDKQGQMRLVATPQRCRLCHKEAPRHQPRWITFLAQRTRTKQKPKQKKSALIFSHSRHAARKKTHKGAADCRTCHGPVTSRKGGLRVPTMARCLSCHVHKKDFDTMRCKRCHTDLRRFPLKPLSLYQHTPNFVKTHKHHAKGRIDLCVTCHDQPFCARCHDPKLPVKPSLRFPDQAIQGYIHRGDYVSRHGRDARLRPASCGRCHGRSGCVDCHQKQKKQVLRGARVSPHPAGYARRGGRAFHGRDARRDPSRCASCHDQGPHSNCVKCHRVGGIGGNPHPPGWKTGRFRGRLDPKRNGMCRYCHGSAL